MHGWIVLSIAVFWLSFSGKILDAASAPAKSVVAHAAVNARVLPLWMAKEQGFFNKYGVPADTISFGSADPGGRLTSGDIHIATWRHRGIGGRRGGSDLKIWRVYQSCHL